MRVLDRKSEVYRYIYDVEYDHTRYLLNICESFDDFSTEYDGQGSATFTFKGNSVQVMHDATH